MRPDLSSSNRHRKRLALWSLPRGGAASPLECGEPFGVRRALAALLYRVAMLFLLLLLLFLLLLLLLLLLLGRCCCCFRYPFITAQKRLASGVLQGGNCGWFAVFVVAPRRVKAARARRTPKGKPRPRHFPVWRDAARRDSLWSAAAQTPLWIGHRRTKLVDIPRNWGITRPRLFPVAGAAGRPLYCRLASTASPASSARPARLSRQTPAGRSQGVQAAFCRFGHPQAPRLRLFLVAGATGEPLYCYLAATA